MEPAPYTALFNRVKATLPSGVDANIRQEISAVMADFTKDTNIWTEMFTINVQPNVFQYPITPAQGTPYRLMLVYDPAQTTNAFPRWVDNSISMPVPGVINVVRVPAQPTTWNAIVAKMCSTPLLVSTPSSPLPQPTPYPAIDGWIVLKNADVLYHGTLAWLQRQQAKPYTDPKMHGQNRALYLAGKARARVDVQKENTYGAQAWTYPQGWATVSRKGWA